ncbi:MAG TPA: GNAT family N-acetyltransferase [Ktedonobacteraceae bacterium]|nr:GNAT family N-acetyltransferase [Ktedonobacteraceae bacterium]
MMNQTVPIMTSSLANEIEACITAYATERLRMLRALPGNPYQADVRAFGKATALVVGQWADDTLSNRIGNMSGAELSSLKEILAWYETYHAHCRFEIIPSHADVLLLRHLAASGFYQSGFYTVLYGVPFPQKNPSPHIHIRKVLPQERAMIAALYLESFQVPQERVSYVQESMGLLIEQPHTTCLFALIGQEIAALAVLYTSHPIGYLALSATRPSFRGRGCQKALLFHRLEIARAAQCQLIVGQADFASISHQNMEKMGLRIAYTKADWTAFA